jgi:XTP/dITP diphosphohydrolase
MRLVFATNNAHKVEEVRAVLAGTGITVIPLGEAGIDVDPPETGDTFVDNALQKARYVHHITGDWCIADDSGLEVDALDGAPGVHSKRFSPEATAEANNALLIDRMADHHDRTARFRCVLALVGPDVARTVAGTCEGHIATTLSGTAGFGYDPLFLPVEADGRTMAELTMAEKNAISHRGRAFRQLPEILP